MNQYLNNNSSVSLLPKKNYFKNKKYLAEKEGIKCKSKLKNKPLIACIDDSRSVQLFVTKTLCLSGYRVLNIINPAAQLLELFNNKPNLILMDINMPELNGYQLCKILQKNRLTKDIPIVMLTGKKGMIPRIKAKFYRIKSYITKPCSAQDLIDTVAKEIDKG